MLAYHVHLHPLCYNRCDSLVSLNYEDHPVCVCILDNHDVKSSCTMAGLIAEHFVMPCLMWASDLRLPVGVVDCPESEFFFHEKGR